MAEVSTFNAATHTKTGVEQEPVQPSDTSVTPDGNLQQPIPEVPTPEPIADTPATTTEPPAVAPTEPEVKENEVAFSMGLPEEPTPTEPTPTQPTYDWKQEITKIPKEELYAHLGLNDFTVKLNEHLSKGGKAQDFIVMQGIDFDTVPDDQLVMEDLKAKNPNLSPSEIKRKYERLYGFDDETEAQEKEDKQIDLKSAAYQVRVAKKNEQANYQMPAPIPVKDEAYLQWQNENRQNEELKTKIKTYYSEHPATKSLKENKRVVIDLGSEVPNFNIVLSENDANVLTNRLAESALYEPPLLTNTGELDVAKHQLIAIFKSNPQAFISEIFNYGKKMGLRGVVQQGQNAQRPNTPVSTMQSATPQYGTGTYNQSVHAK